MSNVVRLPSSSYKDLTVWQKAMTLVTNIYLLTKSFPKEEIYSLTNQMRRAAVSIPSNIAEGKAKRSKKDYVNFLCTARGSAAELETQLIISQNLAYASAEQIDPLVDDINEIGRMLSGLIAKLENPST
jgi:four helix bundle protein